MFLTHTGGVATQTVSISDDDVVNVSVEAGEVVASDPDVDAARAGDGL